MTGRPAAPPDRHLYRYAATVTDVYDGDTITVDLDLGLNIHHRSRRVRLWGIDTPELRGPERPAGLVARDQVRGLISGAEVVLKTHRDSTGRYGRLLAEVFYEAEGHWVNLNQHLVEAGLAEFNTYGDPFEGWASLGPWLLAE